MPTGFSSVLPDGQTIQIDENYKNLELRGKYQLTATNLISVGSPNTYDVSLSVAGVTNPIIAIHCPGVYVALISTSQSGSNVTYRFAALSNTSSFTVYVFDNPTLSASNFGMQVFDANGQLVFDANKRYLRVLSSTSFSNFSQAGITFPADGGVYGYVPSGFLGYFEDYHDAYDNGQPFSVKTKGAVFWAMSGSSLVPLMQQFWAGSRGSVGITSPFYYELAAGTIQMVNLTGM